MAKESSEDTSLRMMQSVLQTMGIDKEEYDEQVLSALLEISHRLASELLCDAKDYSEHAEHSDIEVEDIRLAIHLGENRYNGLDPRQEVINKVVKTINSKDLYSTLDKDAVLHRYPSKLHENMLQRVYTYVPGEEAYGDVQITNEPNTAIMATPQVEDQPTGKKFKPIVLKK